MQMLFCREFGEFFVIYHMPKDSDHIHKETFEDEKAATARSSVLIRNKKIQATLFIDGKRRKVLEQKGSR
jgi:hypothetical protein